MENHRKSPRADFINYDEGFFFVTGCTKERIHYFGKIIDGVMHFTQLGEYVSRQLENANTFTKRIDVPEFVVMPNHFHAMVKILPDPKDQESMPISQRNPNPTYRAFTEEKRHVTVLAKYIASFRGAVTKYARSINHREFEWQQRFHDHYIRGYYDGNRIATYIQNNVGKWEEDCFFNEK